MHIWTRRCTEQAVHPKEISALVFSFSLSRCASLPSSWCVSSFSLSLLAFVLWVCYPPRHSPSNATQAGAPSSHRGRARAPPPPPPSPPREPGWGGGVRMEVGVRMGADPEILGSPGGGREEGAEAGLRLGFTLPSLLPNRSVFRFGTSVGGRRSAAPRGRQRRRRRWGRGGRRRRRRARP